MATVTRSRRVEGPTPHHLATTTSTTMATTTATTTRAARQNHNQSSMAVMVNGVNGLNGADQPSQRSRARLKRPLDVSSAGGAQQQQHDSKRARTTAGYGAAAAKRPRDLHHVSVLDEKEQDALSKDEGINRLTTPAATDILINSSNNAKKPSRLQQQQATSASAVAGLLARAAPAAAAAASRAVWGRKNAPKQQQQQQSEQQPPKPTATQSKQQSATPALLSARSTPTLEQGPQKKAGGRVANGVNKHRDRALNGIGNSLHPGLFEYGRKLRSQEQTRFKSELSAYFPDYDEIIGNDPKEERKCSEEGTMVVWLVRLRTLAYHCCSCRHPQPRHPSHRR